MKRILSITIALLLVLTLAPGAFAEEKVTLNIGLANNPYSQALYEIITTYFKDAGYAFDVNVSVIPEEDLRSAQTLDASTSGVTYDMFYVGPYEGYCWGSYGWLEPLNAYFDAMTEEEKAWYDIDDIFYGMLMSVADAEGTMFAIPFYGESSFVMYNTELFEKAGITMPENPTWDDILELSTAIDGLGDEYTGIVMRSDAGWGNLGAALGAMQDAFGCKYYDMDWNACIDSEEFRNCWSMYKTLLSEYGPENLVGNSYNECVNLFLQGNVGLYYDATSLCGNFESEESPIKGKVGYVKAPTQVEGGNSNWMWNWSMGINPESTHKDEVFQFLLWCTSKDYSALTLEHAPDGSITPPAARHSTYEYDVIKALPYAEATVAAVDAVDFTDPCVDPVPYVGAQYMAIVEFQELGNQMTEWVIEYLSDNITLDEAIAKTQTLFEEIGEDYQ